jgi:hypothetical protein
MNHNKKIAHVKIARLLLFVCFLWGIYFFPCPVMCQTTSQNEKVKELFDLIQKGLPPNRGQELLEVLNSKEITSKEKNDLLRALRTATLKVVKHPTTMALPGDSIPDNIKEQIQREQEKIKHLDQQIDEIREKIISKELEIVKLFDKNGCTDLAYTQLEIAVKHEEKMGIIEGEKKVAAYEAGEFGWKLLQDGERLIRVLNSSIVPLSSKKDVLLNLQEAVSKGDFLSK